MVPPSSSLDDGPPSSYEPSQPDDEEEEEDERAFHLFQPLPTQLQAQPAPPTPPTDSPFAQALDQAYFRYLQAIDEIAEKYRDYEGQDEVVEVDFGDMVEGMVDGLTEDVKEEEEGPTEGGEEEAEVGEGEGEEEEKREVEVVLITQRQKGGGGLGLEKRKEGSDKLFREDGNPTWCWVEPNSPFSSELITSLLQNGASLTPSLQSASHVLLSTSSTSTLSSLQRSILETKLPGQWIVSFDWVRDCLTTGVRLREVGYEVRWGGAREAEGRDAKGKGREREGDLLGVGRGKGVSSTAPGRMKRDDGDVGGSTSDLIIPAFRSKPKLEPPLPNPALTPTLAPPPLPPTNALASSSKLQPQPPIQSNRGLPPPPTIHKPTPTSSLKPLPLLALPIPPRPSNPLLPTSSSSHKTNPTSSFSLLGSMPPPPLPPPKPNQHQPSTKKRPVAVADQQQPTKRPRHLGLGAGMSRLSKVPSLLSSIRGVALGRGGGERKEGS